MTLLTTQIFCGGLILTGVLILVRAIPMMLKTFYGRVKLHMPYRQQTALFTVTEARVHGIWEVYRLHRKTAAANFRPAVYSYATNCKVPLRQDIKHKSLGVQAQSQRFTFFAEPGLYRLTLEPGMSMPKKEAWISRFLPLFPFKPSRYFLEVKDNSTDRMIRPSLMLFLLGDGCLMAAIILASQVGGMMN